MKYISIIAVTTAIFFLFIFTTQSFAQLRIAVLPFQNKDGKLSLNIWSYKLQDSLTKVLYAKDNAEKYYRIVPIDSVEGILAQLNLDPTNPQYASDVWVAIKSLNVKYVVMGNFNIEANKFLINAYIYDVRTKLAVPDYQAKDLFKSEENIMSSIEEIVDSIFPFFTTPK